MTDNSLDRSHSDAVGTQAPNSVIGEPQFHDDRSSDREDEAPSIDDLAADEVTAGAGMPGWFARRRAKQTEQPSPQRAQQSKDQTQATGRAAKIAVATDEDEELPWPQQVKAWLKSKSAAGYAVSFLFHLLLLLILSFILIKGMDKNQAFSTILGEADNELTEFEEFDTQLDMASSDADITQLPQLQLLTTQLPNLPTNLDPNIAIAGKGDGDADGGSGFKFRMPKGGKAITKGSFTVWTDPVDPAPRESYRIIIQIKLPKRVRRYPVQDLTGIVVGTDGYRKRIPADLPRKIRFLQVKNHQTQLAILIPGAERLVKDTIQVSSKILKEKQNLRIEF